MPTLAVFVSSTFRDFQAERDLLSGPLRNRLNELVQPFGCRVQFVDLRWGVDTEGLTDDARHDRVLDVCLGEIRRCRPLFVGLIGDRSGWVPPPQRMQEVCESVGFDAPPAGTPLTVLEFEFGALRSGNPHALFFDRRLDFVPPAWRDPGPAIMQRLRERLPSRQTYRYSARCDGAQVVDLTEFESVVMNRLGPVLVARARTLTAEGTNEQLIAERLFIDRQLEGYVPLIDLLDAVHADLVAGRSVCLYGPSGIGKSANWSWLVTRLRGEGRQVASHVVQATATSLDHDGLVRRLLVQLGVAPPKLPKLSMFERILTRVITAPGMTKPAAIGGEALLMRWAEVLDSTRAVVCVDGLDRLAGDEATRRLDLLRRIPAASAFLTTTSSPPQAELLADRGFRVVTLPNLHSEQITQLAERLASAAHKQLPRRALMVLTATGRSPLWVRLAMGELASLTEADLANAGEDGPSQIVAQAAEALPADLNDLIERAVARLSLHYGGETVRLLLAALSVSWHGLSPEELAATVGCSQLAAVAVVNALDTILARGADDRVTLDTRIAEQAVRSLTAPYRDRAQDLLVARLESLKPRSAEDDLELLHVYLRRPPAEAAVLQEAIRSAQSRDRLTAETAATLTAALLLDGQTSGACLVALERACVGLVDAPQVGRRGLRASPLTDPVLGLLDDLMSDPRLDAREHNELFRIRAAVPGAVSAPTDTGDSRPRKLTPRDLAESVDRRLQAIGALVNHGRRADADAAIEELLNQARELAYNTRFAGPWYELARILAIAVDLSLEGDALVDAHVRAEELLKLGDLIPPDEPGQDRALTRLAAMAALATVAVRRGQWGEAARRLDDAIATAQGALEAMAQPVLKRQGIAILRYSHRFAVARDTAAEEFSVIAELRDRMLRALAQRLALDAEHDKGARVEQLHERLLAVSAAARHAENDPDQSAERVRLLAEVGAVERRFGRPELAASAFGEIVAEARRYLDTNQLLRGMALQALATDQAGRADEARELYRGLGAEVRAGTMETVTAATDLAAIATALTRWLELTSPGDADAPAADEAARLWHAAVIRVQVARPSIADKIIACLRQNADIDEHGWQADRARTALAWINDSFNGSEPDLTDVEGELRAEVARGSRAAVRALGEFLLAQAGRAPEGEQLLTRSWWDDGDDDARESLAQHLGRAGRWADLEQACREGVRRGRRDDLIELGIAIWNQEGRSAEAEPVFRTALAEGIRPAVALVNLGQLVGEAGRIDEALALLTEASQRGHVEAAALRAVELLEKGPRDSEVEHWYRLAIADGSAKAAAYLARRLWEQGEEDELPSLYRLAIERGHGPAPCVELACLMRMREPERESEAVQLVRDALAGEIRWSVLDTVVRQKVIDRESAIWALLTVVAEVDSLPPTNACASPQFLSSVARRAAEFLDDAGRGTEMIALYRGLVDRGRSEFTARLAVALRRQGGDLDEVKRLFRQCVELGVEPTMSTLFLGHIAEHDGETVDAIHWYEKALAAGDVQFGATFLARVLMRGPRDAEVNDLLRRGLEAGSGSAAMMLARRLWSAGETDELITLYQFAAEHGQDEVWFELAGALHEAGRDDEAMATTRTAVERGTTYDDVRMAALRSFVPRETAFWLLRQIAASISTDNTGADPGLQARILVLLHMLLRKADRRQEAWEAAQAAVDIGYVRANGYLGQLEEDAGNFEAAIGAYELASQDDVTWPLMDLARLYQRLGQIDDMRAAVVRVLHRVEPADVVESAEEMIEHGDTEIALLFLRASVAEGNLSARGALGRAILNAGGSAEEALELFRFALQDGDGEAALGLGRIYAERGETTQAESVFRRGIELGNDGCSYELGTLLMTQGRLDESEALLKRANDAGLDQATEALARLADLRAGL